MKVAGPLRAIGEAMIEMAPVPGGLYRRGFAGDTYNTAWHVARLLGPAADVGMVTRIGRDAISDAFLAGMAADGMSVAGVSRDPARVMGLYLIELDGTERSFHYWRETSAARRLADDSVALAAALDGAGLVHLSGITLAILSDAARETLFQAVALARRSGTVVSFDPNIRPRLWSSPDDMRATVTRMLTMTDVSLPSFDDERQHFGDAAPRDTLARHAAAGVAEVVLKDGPGPVWLWCDGREQVIPTPPVTGIRDTTGAGDAFNAGYLAARMTGGGVAQAVGLGQSLAGVVLQHFGARAPREAVAAARPGGKALGRIDRT